MCWLFEAEVDCVRKNLIVSISNCFVSMRQHKNIKASHKIVAYIKQFD
jgi:hypothetical protein